MKKIKNIKIFQLVIIIILLLLIVLFINEKINKNTEICIKEKCFSVEIAKTSEERQEGLMFRKTLDADKGMLFVFEEEGFYSFWMKNTLIPLDIIWISKDNKIVYIEDNVLPCDKDLCKSYSPTEKALYVLEINSKLSGKYGFKEGDEIKLILEDSKRKFNI